MGKVTTYADCGCRLLRGSRPLIFRNWNIPTSKNNAFIEATEIILSANAKTRFQHVSSQWKLWLAKKWVFGTCWANGGDSGEVDWAAGVLWKVFCGNVNAFICSETGSLFESTTKEQAANFSEPHSKLRYGTPKLTKGRINGCSVKAQINLYTFPLTFHVALTI